MFIFVYTVYIHICLKTTSLRSSKSLGQAFYKLDEEDLLYTRADIHLTRKEGLPEDYKHLESFDGEIAADKVSKDVDARICIAQTFFLQPGERRGPSRH